MLAPFGPPNQAGREKIAGPTEEWLAVSRAGPAHGHLRDRRGAGDVVPGDGVVRLIGRVDVVVGALDDMTRTE